MKLEQLHAAGLHAWSRTPATGRPPRCRSRRSSSRCTRPTPARSSALFSGQIDWTGNYIPGLQHSFISTNPEFHHHWEAPGGTNSLVPNLNKWPTNQLPVRQAISAAINRQLLASEGESGLENPVLNATGLTPQLFDAWSGPVASMTVSATGSAAAAAADPAEGLLTHQGIGRLLRQGRQEGLDHDHEPVALTPTTPRSTPSSRSS